MPPICPALHHRRVQMLEILEQSRIPRLDEATVGEVLHVADTRVDDVRLEAGTHLAEGVRLICHEGELRLHVRVGRCVLLPEVLDLVPRPVEHLQVPRLGRRAEPRQAGRARAPRPDARENSHTAQHGRPPQELFSRQPALVFYFRHPLLLVWIRVVRLDSSPSGESSLGAQVTASSSAWESAPTVLAVAPLPLASTVRTSRPCCQAMRYVGLSEWQPHPFGR